jgi:general secretion pathway protein D
MRIALGLLCTMLAVVAAQQPTPPAKPEAAAAQTPAAAAKPPAPPQAPAAQAPAAAQPVGGAGQAPAAAAKPPATQTAPVQVEPAAGGGFVLNLQNASLTDVIDVLARRLKINYILDPRVKGSVTLNTYGELRAVDVRPLLETILRINGAAMVQVGEFYRIVPAGDVPRLPLTPQIDIKTFPEDERMLMNLVFLKYATVGELTKLLQPFLGEGAVVTSYDPANLLIILDNARNMRRTMELIALFDSDTFAAQRVRLFETKHSRPSDIAKELENIFKSISLAEKTSPVRFMPLDRINTIIAVAPNPGVFEQVEKWLAKLDIPVKVTAGAVDNYVYRVRYGRAETLAQAIMMLYMGMTYGFGYGMFGLGFGGLGYGMGYGGYGMGYGGYGMGYGGYGMGYGAYPGYGAMMPGYGYPGVYTPGQPGTVLTPTGPVATTAGTQPQTDITGTYLGAAAAQAQAGLRGPRVVPNPFDNTLLIQATPQEYEQILKLLRELDVPPRQVLVEAKIYEVSLTGSFASGVMAYLQSRGGGDVGNAKLGSRTFQAAATGNGTQMTAGLLVGRSRELLAFLTAQEATGRARVISAPSVIATDSIPASINVGTEVPTLAAQAVSPIQSGGTSLFTNAIVNRQSGVTLNVLARVNPTGIVTLVINQEVSAPQPPAATAAIQSPSFSKRSVQTQVTVNDGDTIAIGGIIQESNTQSSQGVPVLHRLPLVGGLFGNRSTTKERTELIVFMTPRVIYDTTEIVEASEELKMRLKGLRKLVKE